MDTNSLAGIKLHFLPIDPAIFPGKLWNLVNDPQINSVCWDASGEGILLHQQSFEAEVLLSRSMLGKRYFKTTNFTSFIRQLNMYGFRKVRPDQDNSEDWHDSFCVKRQVYHFHNPNFKRDKPDLLGNLKRLTPRNKAKLATGIKLTSKSSKCFPHLMLYSPERSSPVLTKGPILLGHRGTPCPHHRSNPQQVKACSRIPQSPQAFIMGHNDPSPVTLFTNKFVTAPVFQAFPMNPQSACASSPHGPHHSQYNLYTPVHQNYNPGILDQGADWKAADAPDFRKSGLKVNLDTVFKIAEEMQAVTDIKEVAVVSSYLEVQSE